MPPKLYKKILQSCGASWGRACPQQVFKKKGPNIRLDLEPLKLKVYPIKVSTFDPFIIFRHFFLLRHQDIENILISKCWKNAHEESNLCKAYNGAGGRTR